MKSFRALGVAIVSGVVWLSALPCATALQGNRSGNSADGAIFWELGPPADDSSKSTIWIWPKGAPDQAVRLVEVNRFWDIHFSNDDGWILIQDSINLDSFIDVFERESGFRYSAVDIELFDYLPHRGEVHFDDWVPEYGKDAFRLGIFGLMPGGPRSDLYHFRVWVGVYDLSKRSVVKVLDKGQTETALAAATNELESWYVSLREGYLDAKGQEQLTTEWHGWMKEQDAIRDSKKKLSFVYERADGLQLRLMDAILNDNFHKLRAGLDGVGQAKLDSEEEAWLKKANAIDDPITKLSFVRERADELENRRLGR